MSNFGAESDLQTESDVEQKFLWPLLTTAAPRGLGYKVEHLKTKHNLKTVTINKGSKAQVYFPDYIAVLAGLPTLVVEAKAPSVDPVEGFREARLYAAEINALFPPGINPVIRIIASNGLRTCAGYADNATPELILQFSDFYESSLSLQSFRALVSHDSLWPHVQPQLTKLRSSSYTRPVDLLGGQYIRNEEIPPNTFGTTLSLNLRYIFNPGTREERAYIATNAYIPSLRRERYIDPIDKIIRAAAPPSLSDATLIEDTSRPAQVLDKLRDTKPLEHQILLLIGGVGAGKSTFVDYLQEVALPKDISTRTVWAHVDMNSAPLDLKFVYDWLCDKLLVELRETFPKVDFDVYETIEKIFSVEITRAKKGPLALLANDPDEYNRRLVDYVLDLQSDKVGSVRAMNRHLCGERGKLLILVLDNCDKRVRDDQLLMFQVAQWAQKEFRCLVVLPLRDVTYDHYRHEPPLDTALKDLVFRIEPPMFAKVLARRIDLALKDMSRDNRSKSHHYDLPNGIRVEYPDTDQGLYLGAIR